MKKHLTPLLLTLTAGMAAVAPFRASHAQTPPVSANAVPAKKKSPVAYPERAELWEKAIAAFESRDRESGMPAPGGILFTGSSSIVGWKTLAKDFPGLPLLNRGFGGSQIQDVTFFASRAVLPYKPRAVVFYAGDNDIAAGHTTEQVVGDFQTFALKVRDALPDTRLIFLAIKPSPSRWKLEARMLAANRAIARWMETQPNMAYVDVHTPMLGPDGMPRPELYGPDRLHMTPEGYRLWTAVLAPYLK